MRVRKKDNVTEGARTKNARKESHTGQRKDDPAPKSMQGQ